MDKKTKYDIYHQYFLSYINGKSFYQIRVNNYNNLNLINKNRFNIENHLMFTFINSFNFNTNNFNTNNLKYNIYLNRCLFQLLSLLIYGQDITFTPTLIER